MMLRTSINLGHILCCLFGPALISSMPRFDPTALLQDVLIPSDAATRSIIYRLRASDPTFDYPLHFTLQGKATTISIENLNCTRLNSICQANVILQNRLEPGRFYDFSVEVQNQRGEISFMNCSFRATNATTPIADIFPGAPTLLMVSEKARRNTELGSIIAKGNPSRPNGVLLELWGSPEFALHQKLITERDAQGTILLLKPLDYEKTTVHHLTILANDPWTEINKDTRNIASWPLLVAVTDVQDTPPVFTLAPPITTLSPTLQPGDLILTVHAEDGDRGHPRDIRYGLVAEDKTQLFDIDEKTGELHLAQQLAVHSNQPILLTVIAEEVRANPEEPPAQSSSVRLALIPPGVTAGTPTLGANEYTTLLPENAPTGTTLNLPQTKITTQPGDIVTLELTNCNGTFDISPTVVEGQSTFTIKVHDPKLLDYEKWHSVECHIVAREVGSGNFTARAKLKVLLTDVNDNDPKFSQPTYEASIPEGAKVGTVVLRVEAEDVDREPGNKVKFTSLSGPGSQYFDLDPITGLVTVGNSQGMNAEESPAFVMNVEAADEDGLGRSATTKITVNLIDINDERPLFEKEVYEFILEKDKRSFTSPAFIKAIDRDITSPNNEIRYEIINPVESLFLNENTGELRVEDVWREIRVVVTTARAYDGGVPRLWSECEVRIYPPEDHSRKIAFIVPGRNPDRENVLNTIQALTGARVTIDEIRPYTGYEPGAADLSQQSTSEKSVVVATVNYSRDNVVDVNKIQQILDRGQPPSRIENVETRKGGSLLWLLILLVLLLLLTALALVFCCICEGCPLYVPPKKRRAVSADIQKLVKGSGNGRESKSVQVAEWFGRKEAWSPEHVDNEAESLRRHEMERGSDRVENRRVLLRQQTLHREPSRDQLYIREGNTDILRLITRGGEQIDAGKDILMRRYIDQQSEAIKTNVSLSNGINKLQAENELLENSLRQQNMLLRQILLERERDLRLETQSLPAGTQTDRDAGTQTSPLNNLRPPIREVQSDNDASDGSDDEYAIIRERANRRNGRLVTKTHVRRKIKTPIQEESDNETSEVKAKQSKPTIKQTRTSELRQKKISNEIKSRSSSGIQTSVLREITQSLNNESDEGNYFTDDSLEEISPRSYRSYEPKYRSDSDLRVASSQTTRSEIIKPTKYQSHADLTEGKTKKKPARRTSRYMEWYQKPVGKEVAKQKVEPKTKSVKKPAKKSSRKDTSQIKEDEIIKEKVKISSTSKNTSTSTAGDGKKNAVGPDHPLLQHSEYRYEAPYPLVNRRPEEDADSGIALTRPLIAHKKSVFTIAYDDMQTRQIRPDSDDSPPL